jgi:hypothetical protein
MAHTGIGFVSGGFHLTCGLQHGENLQEGDSLSLPRPQISKNLWAKQARGF